MNKQKCSGGARAGAGAKPKPVEQRKIPVSTYHKSCDIENIGGMDAARETAHSAIERKIKKILK